MGVFTTEVAEDTEVLGSCLNSSVVKILGSFTTGVAEDAEVGEGRVESFFTTLTALLLYRFYRSADRGTDMLQGYLFVFFL